MERDPETQLLEKRHILSWAQVDGFADPMLVIRSEADTGVAAVQAEALQRGLEIESMDITVEVQIRAYAK